MILTEQDKAELARAEEWNKTHPIGTLIALPNGTQARTQSLAYMDWLRSKAIVLVEGYSVSWRLSDLPF